MDADIDQYCLRWKYHHSNLQYMFAQLLENGSLCDVTLACEGKTIRVHKIMLSACSSYFELIFSKHDENDPIVILDGTRFDDITALVEFMYRGEITVEKSRLNALIETAEELQVKGLAAVSWRSTSQGWIGAECELSNDSSNPLIQTGVKRKLSESIINDNAKEESKCDTSSTPVQNLIKPKLLETLIPKPIPPCPSPTTNSDKDPSVNVNNVVNSVKKQKIDGMIPKILTVPKVVMPLQIPKSSLLSVTKNLMPQNKEMNATNPQGSSLTPVKEEALSDGELSDGSLPVISGILSLTQREKEEFSFSNIVKMNDHIQQGGWRPHFWELETTKKVMDAIKNKKLEMKFAAELLGVTYGTLYGRYREVHGYLKQPQREFWHDVRFAEILGKLKRKEITLFTAADLMNVSASVLANHLAKAEKETSDNFLGQPIPLPMMDLALSKSPLKLMPPIKPLMLVKSESSSNYRIEDPDYNSECELEQKLHLEPSNLTRKLPDSEVSDNSSGHQVASPKHMFPAVVGLTDKENEEPINLSNSDSVVTSPTVNSIYEKEDGCIDLRKEPQEIPDTTTKDSFQTEISS